MSAATSHDYLKPVGLRAIASFLILWTPLFAFSAYRGHPIPVLSFVYFAVFFAVLALLFSVLCGRQGHILQAILFTFLVALFLDVQAAWFSGAPAYAACLAMLALFWLLKRHLSAILISIFTVLLISTAVVGSVDPYAEVRRAEIGDPVISENAKPHRIIHLLLDEHAGIQGIPEDLHGGKELRQELREFFVSNGFRLFGNAVSEYQASRNSIAGILNFTAGPEPYRLYRGKSPFVLTKNAYFETLSEAGYSIDVYQTTYMDFCSDEANLVNRCATYRYDGSDWLRDADLSALEKFQLFLSLYLKLSDILEVGLKAYAKLDRSLQQQGVQLPALLNWPAPIALNAFDDVAAGVTAGPGDRLYFAHLLFPHGPFAFDAQCRLRDDISTWPGYRPPYRKANNERERAFRFRYYFEQVRCTKHRLQLLFDRLKQAGLYDDATIILHGDHGSRIFLNRPRANNRENLSRQDFIDNFSTLFAAKSPAFEAGYDDERLPVSQLLARAIGRADLIDRSSQELLIYLEGSDDYDPWTGVLWKHAD